MNLLELAERTAPRPWAEGDNIPWNEPEFSRRMLKEHLSQEHDAASRRYAVIDRQVGWIHETVLGGQPARVLDLGCGPGLYAQRLARLGHSVRGIDFSPASIEYARQLCEGLDCTFELADVRIASYGERDYDLEARNNPAGEYDLVMFLFGEINVFSPVDARRILRKAQAALKPAGRLLLEPSTEAAARALGHEPSAWYTAASGLFSDRPHLMLFEAFWDEEQRAASHRHMRVDAATAEVTRWTASYQCYSQPELTALLRACGFDDVRFAPALDPQAGAESEFWAVTASKEP